MATTAEEEETTATFTTERGSSVRVKLSDIDAAAERLRQADQLSFDVGDADGKDRPDFASLKISGSLPLGGDLKRRTSLRVQIVSQEGEVLADRVGVVTSIQFKDETKDGATTTERIHTVKVP